MQIPPNTAFCFVASTMISNLFKPQKKLQTEKRGADYAPLLSNELCAVLS